RSQSLSRVVSIGQRGRPALTGGRAARAGFPQRINASLLQESALPAGRRRVGAGLLGDGLVVVDLELVGVRSESVGTRIGVGDGVRARVLVDELPATDPGCVGGGFWCPESLLCVTGHSLHDGSRHL